MVDGDAALTIEGDAARARPGGYAFLPPGSDWTLRNDGRRDRDASTGSARPTSGSTGIDVPEAFVTNEVDVAPAPMPGTDGAWATQRFVDPTTSATTCTSTSSPSSPAGSIPFPETHVMEHGLYVLEGKAVYLLNKDWVEVQEGDFMWLRAFCPQACYAGGPGRFRYLLYKDVNRHPRLRLGAD